MSMERRFYAISFVSWHFCASDFARELLALDDAEVIMLVANV